MKYLSLFSGIGGFELAIQRAIPEAECIGYSEIDKYAIKVYERHFNHENIGDITTVNPNTLPDFDLLVGGFPCQAFSVAGKRLGFDDTRGTLFFDIARILKEKQPRHLVLENVKGLLSHDSGRTFTTILGVLSDLGYFVEWQVLNAKDFGVPQNRERIFIVGHLGGQPRRKVFPIYGGATTHIKYDVRGSQRFRAYNPSGLAPTIPTMQGGNTEPKIFAQAVDLTRREKTNHRVRKDDRAGTLDANYYKGLANQERPGVKEGKRIRRLTPLECERLMAYPDNWTKYGIGDEPISDTQRYKMCGNGVVSNVVQAVIERIL